MIFQEHTYGLNEEKTYSLYFNEIFVTGEQFKVNFGRILAVRN
jgi:hypothetical protein